MIDDILLYIGSAIITVWGMSHIVPTKSVVDGFGAISQDNKRIITLEWIAGGLALCFIGLLVLLVTIIAGSDTAASKITYWASAVMLVIMAIVSAFTGARTSIIPMRICPIIQGLVAILFIVGTII